MYPACSGLGKLESHGRGRLKCTQPIPTGHIGVTCCLYSQCIQYVPGGYLGPCPQCHDWSTPLRGLLKLETPLSGNKERKQADTPPLKYVEQMQGQRQTGRNDLPGKGERVASGW